MRKVIYKHYGDEAVLELSEQPIPVVGDNELLIRVKAVSINPLDWKIYRGEMKMMSGSRFPKTVGIDFSGIVEKTGSLVTRFSTNDEVFGLLDVFKGGALADYIVVKETDIALKPAGIPFEQAAALPVTGLSALQIIDELCAVKPHQEVLINGATGGIGMFAVQIAKRRGAKITAVANTPGIEHAKAWGADEVIDYTSQDISLMPRRFDAVIDLSAKLSFRKAQKLMRSKAIFASTLPSPAALISSVVRNLFYSQKRKILILKPTAAGLAALARLSEDHLQIRLDKTYPLENVRQAYHEASEGRVIGKSVIVP